MTRWAQGADKVQQLLDQGDLQQVQGADTDGQPLLDKAHRTLASAASLRDTDPESSYTLTYDAARFACSALLAQQGLRATSRGGHYAVEQTMRAQFQRYFRTFGALRRRRNELEYPTADGADVSADEIAEATRDAEAIIDAATRLLPHLQFF